MHTHTHAHTHAHACTCMHAHAHAHTHACTHAHTHTHMHTHVHVCTSVPYILTYCMQTFLVLELFSSGYANCTWSCSQVGMQTVLGAVLMWVCKHYVTGSCSHAALPSQTKLLINCEYQNRYTHTYMHTRYSYMYMYMINSLV